MRASGCENGILMKVEVEALFLEAFGRPLQGAELGSGPKRGGGRCEIETLHGERGLGVIRSGSGVRKRTSGHTLEGGRLERRWWGIWRSDRDTFIRLDCEGHGGHHREMMAGLMGAYRIRRLDERL